MSEKDPNQYCYHFCALHQSDGSSSIVYTDGLARMSEQLSADNFDEFREKVQAAADCEKVTIISISDIGI